MFSLLWHLTSSDESTPMYTMHRVASTMFCNRKQLKPLWLTTQVWAQWLLLRRGAAPPCSSGSLLCPWCSQDCGCTVLSLSSSHLMCDVSTCVFKSPTSFFPDRVSFCPGTCCTDQTGLELRDSASPLTPHLPPWNAWIKGLCHHHLAT